MANGGIAISGLSAGQAVFNETYAPTGALIEGFPAFTVYSVGPQRHLFRDPKFDKWCLTNKPFDPAEH